MESNVSVASVPLSVGMPKEERLFIDGQVVVFKYDFNGSTSTVTMEDFNGTTTFKYNNSSESFDISSDFLTEQEISDLKNFTDGLSNSEVNPYSDRSIYSGYQNDGWLNMGYSYGDTKIARMTVSAICGALSAALRVPASVFTGAASAIVGNLDVVYWKQKTEIRGVVSGMEKRVSIWLYRDANRTDFIRSAKYETLELI